MLASAFTLSHAIECFTQCTINSTAQCHLDLPFTDPTAVFPVCILLPKRMTVTVTVDRPTSAVCVAEGRTEISPAAKTHVLRHVYGHMTCYMQPVQSLYINPVEAHNTWLLIHLVDALVVGIAVTGCAMALMRACRGRRRHYAPVDTMTHPDWYVPPIYSPPPSP